MNIYPGLDVSDKITHVCAVDADGAILWRDVCASGAGTFQMTSSANSISEVRNRSSSISSALGPRFMLATIPTVRHVGR
jgi:hypothetical protein